MAAPGRSTARARPRRSRSAPKTKRHAPSSSKTPPAPQRRPVVGQVAVRWTAGAEHKVTAALETFGRLEKYSTSRVLILHLDGPPSRVQPVLDRLRTGKLIDFVTPVLVDRESGLRQVLTDEIVVRLKSGAHAKQTLKSLKQEHGLEVARQNEFEPTQYIVKVPDSSGTETMKMAQSLDRRQDVEFASPNFLTAIKR